MHQRSVLLKMGDTANLATYKPTQVVPDEKGVCEFAWREECHHDVLAQG